MIAEDGVLGATLIDVGRAGSVSLPGKLPGAPFQPGGGVHQVLPETRRNVRDDAGHKQQDSPPGRNQGRDRVRRIGDEIA